ncbi:hypothetical protein H2198_007157 [Neophaeococcomyces mojaviensis]|uniref:Uncharacterized protein n=1 Tax=Neophaeococcomyces mojaviensis TaxID=3383035 RepID=A0ACC3A1E0_9EURO|nr:hypothetical protein H2198_007157 [Knufia sp. JES_112]
MSSNQEQGSLHSQASEGKRRQHGSQTAQRGVDQADDAKQQQHQELEHDGQVVQPEPIADDADSALGDEISVYTASVRESIYDFPERYGRTYHAYKEGRYSLPNDEVEMDRLDVHHHVILLAMQKQLFFAPLPADFSGRALDLATGTGIWPIDFACQFPNATVIGNDLSPTMPLIVPPNCHFYVDDIEADWTYSENEKFDFIHARFLAGAIADWPKLMAQSFEHLKPGGWVEFQDWNTWIYSQDGSLPPESALNRFHALTCGGRHAQGFNMRPGPHLEKWIQDAGFVDVEVTKVLLPLGSWPKAQQQKELGVFNLVQMMKGAEAVCLAVLPMLPPEAGGPWELEEIQVFLADIRKDMSNRKIHGVYDFWIVWARKPEA